MQPIYSHQVLTNFIAIEGLDGAGTSTQTDLLAKNLKLHGYHPVATMEPTAGPVGTLIKQIMRGRLKAGATPAQTERQLAYLFAADRYDHLYNEVDGITQTLAKDRVAISTRYFFSSYAYNARTPEDFDLVDRLNRDFPLPQIVVYLTVPPEVSMKRIAGRDVLEFYEKEEELRRVAENYKRIFAPIRDRVIEVESTRDVLDVAEHVCEKVLEKLNNGL
ncbi:dTMP kinase [soil metagenome]